MRNYYNSISKIATHEYILQVAKKLNDSEMKSSTISECSFITKTLFFVHLDIFFLRRVSYSLSIIYESYNHHKYRVVQKHIVTAVFEKRNSSS